MASGYLDYTARCRDLRHGARRRDLWRRAQRHDPRRRGFFFGHVTLCSARELDAVIHGIETSNLDAVKHGVDPLGPKLSLS